MRRQPNRRSGRDPGSRPYAPITSRSGKPRRKHYPHSPCRIGASDSGAGRAGSRAQIVRLCARAPPGGRSVWKAAMLVRCAPVDGPCDPAVVSVDVGGHPGIGEGGTCEQRRVLDAWPRGAAGLMRICRREGEGPPLAHGRRRPFAFGHQVSGRVRERVDVRVAERGGSPARGGRIWRGVWGDPQLGGSRGRCRPRGSPGHCGCRSTPRRRRCWWRRRTRSHPGTRRPGSWRWSRGRHRWRRG